MRSSRLTLWFLILLALGCGTALQAETPRTLLLRWQEAYDDIHGPAEIEILIFRDGLVTARLVSNGLVAEYQRLQMTPAALADLGSVLSANRVGLLVADQCTVPSPFPTSVGSFDITFTWFGRNGRQNRLAITSAALEPCSAQVEEVLSAIRGAPMSLIDRVVTVP